MPSLGSIPRILVHASSCALLREEELPSLARITAVESVVYSKIRKGRLGLGPVTELTKVRVYRLPNTPLTSENNLSTFSSTTQQLNAPLNID